MIPLTIYRESLRATAFTFRGKSGKIKI